MDYTQERVATLHDYGDADPSAPTDRAGVVVPMTDRDAGGLAGERLFGSLETIDVSTVVVPVRAPPGRIESVLRWLSGFEAPIEPVWCNGPELESTLAAHDLDGNGGKGRDVWLALGTVADVEYLLFHDADVTSQKTADLRKLLAPLADGYSFTKAYYARVENDSLYGRLFRLLYDPLVSVLEEAHDDPLVRYLDAFRYALSGEVAMRVKQARAIRVPQRWGLEVGVLGEEDVARRGGEAGAQRGALALVDL
ncbi:MAG: glycosyl transferase family 2, partial [Halanaeroarchaeum sp.]